MDRNIPFNVRSNKEAFIMTTSSISVIDKDPTTVTATNMTSETEEVGRSSLLNAKPTVV